MNEQTMVYIDQHTRPDGSVVAGHWRRQTPRMTPEQRAEKRRMRKLAELREQAKAEQRELGMGE